MSSKVNFLNSETYGVNSAIQLGFVFAILAAITSSSKAVFVKLIYLQSEISALELLLVRLLIALPFFVLLIIWPRIQRHSQYTHLPEEGFESKEKLKLGLTLFWLGFTGYYFASLTDFIGLSYISAGLERLVLFTYPTLVLAIESIWKRRRPSNRTLSGVFICYLGLFAAFSHDLSQTGHSKDIWTGVGWVALSGLSFAFYYLATSSIVAQIGARRLTGYAGIVATICTVIHFALVGNWSFLWTLTNEVWFLIAAISILCTLLPSLFLASAIQRLGPGLTANLGSIGPMLTILIAWWLLGESISSAQILGMGLVVLGIHQMKKVA